MTTLPIDGDADIHFTIDGLPVTVSPAIDELLLGSDWLAQNRCRWDFAAGKVYVGEKLIHTYQREWTDACRRIVVAENCTVPPRHEANVPAHMLRQGRRSCASDWALETEVIRPGVVTARTVLDGNGVDVVVRVCNYLDTLYEFKEDSLLGLAEPVNVDGIDYVWSNL